MSLRTRLLISLTAVLAVAISLAALSLVTLTRAGLIEQVDRDLRAVAGSRLDRIAEAVVQDDVAGRRMALIQFDRLGRVQRALPSGFADAPDPLPELPGFSAGVPDSAVGRITTQPSVDGSLEYRVLVQRGPRGVLYAIAAPLTGTGLAVSSLVRSLLVVGLLLVAAFGAIAWLVVRRGLRPLERFATTAEAITAGDLSHRAGVPHDRTEVGRLSAAFDTMLDQIETSFDRQQAALVAKERSEARLRQFVSDASHELRTPLTAVRGYAELYEAGGLAEAEALDAAMTRIGAEGRRMGSLVEELLFLARLDEGRPIGREPVNIGRVVEDAVSDVRAMDPGRPLGAAITPVVVVGDEDRLRQLVGNLLANVRVHTPPGSPLEVSLGSDGDAAVLTVVDHGPGIEPQHAERVFDRFYRADPGRARDRGGSGLGLAIAGSVAAAHGGTIAHRPTPGGGATFEVRLPLAAGGAGTQAGSNARSEAALDAALDAALEAPPESQATHSADPGA